MRRWTSAATRTVACSVIGQNVRGSASTRVGDPRNGVGTSTASRCQLNDVVGLSLMSDVPIRLPAGEILSLMDLAAGRSALLHLRHYSAQGPDPVGPAAGKDVSCATVAASDMHFQSPLVHGDMANVFAAVVAVGTSSMTVRVEVHRTQFPSRAQRCVAKALFFLVAIRRDLSAAPVVPALDIAPEHWSWHVEAVETKQRRMQLEAYERQLAADAPLESSPHKSRSVRIEETVICANRLFFPGHLNLNNTIFGGEILRWMEMHACHCARLFTRNKRVATIAVQEIKFKRPITVDDWVSLEAAVVYVHNTTLVVDVRLFVESAFPGGERAETANEASFVLTNYDDLGNRQAVDVGLDIVHSSPGWQACHSSANRRYNRRKSLTTIEPLPTRT